MSIDAVATGGLRALVAMAKDLSADSCVSALAIASLICGSTTRKAPCFVSLKALEPSSYSIQHVLVLKNRPCFSRACALIRFQWKPGTYATLSRCNRFGPDGVLTWTATSPVPAI